MLVLEVDLTGLTAKSDGSKKSYFPNKPNKRGRQLVRVIAPQYGEVIFQKLYWGNTNSSEVLKETIKEVERILADLAEESQKRRWLTHKPVVGGFGTDENLNWLCWRGYQFIAKGYSGGRAKKVARSVPEEDWRQGPTERQLLGTPTQPHRYGRRTKSVVRRWHDEKGKVHQDLLITTLTELEQEGPEEVARLYDRRGAMEVDIKGDKRGLGLEKRKKMRFDAQEANVLLAQLAHNLATWFKEWFLAGREAGRLEMERLVREVFAMPGRVVVRRAGWWRSSSSKVGIKLPTLHPWAKAVANGINEHFKQNGLRAIWGET